MCIIFPDVPFILSFSTPPPSLSVQPSNLPSLAHLPFFSLRLPLPPPTCTLPFLLLPFLPPILRLTSFIHHSLAHLALFPTLSDELTLELRDGGREVGVRGMCREGCGGVFEDKCGEVERKDVQYLKRKYLSKSQEEDVHVLH